MAFADYTSYKNKITNSEQIVGTGFTQYSVTQGRWIDRAGSLVPIPIGEPGGTFAYNRTSNGAMPYVESGGTTQLRIPSIQLNGATPGTYMLVDRLVGQSGFVANINTTQTTNCPTAALTRYTSGEGVFAFITIWTQVGATATTFTVSYTNQAGTSGRTSPAQTIGGTGYRESVRAIALPMQEGDTGIRSIESLTIAGTTGTGSQFGVTLVKPLLLLNVTDQTNTESADFLSKNMFGGLPEIIDGSCLMWYSNTFTTGLLNAMVNFTEA